MSRWRKWHSCIALKFCMLCFCRQWNICWTMKHKDGKPINQPNKNRTVTLAVTFIALCGFSFYLGGIFCSGKDGVVVNTIQKTLDSPKQSSGSLQIKPISFPECSIDYQDYTPCTDPKVLNGSHLLILQDLQKNVSLLIEHA